MNTFWQTVITIAGATCGGFAGSALQYQISDRELDIRMVEIGLGILRHRPRAQPETGP